jgi:hypothetical protein
MVLIAYKTQEEDVFYDCLNPNITFFWQVGVEFNAHLTHPLCPWEGYVGILLMHIFPCELSTSFGNFVKTNFNFIPMQLILKS